MRVALVLSSVAVTLLTGCARDDGPRTAVETSSPSVRFDRKHALIDTGERTVLIDVELAATPEAREVGLMHRRSLPEDAGMVFLWFEETSGGFWMKNTLIPLSIAFFDQDGEILEILDMEPCKKDPCRVYDPGVTYWGALEVNQGAFEEWGVSEGDVIRIQS